MTLLGDDVLVCGGIDRQLNLMSSCVLYNASINEWAAAATIQPLPVAMDGFPMITLHTRPYVFGGVTDDGQVNTVYTFETSNKWATRTPMEQIVGWPTAVALDTNTALFCGGASGSAVFSACYSYSTTKDAWSPAAQMTTARSGHGMVVYKGLFVADHDLHNYSGCAQVAYLSMEDLTQTYVAYHPLKCCRSTDRLGQHYQRPCSRPHLNSSPCHCPRQKTTLLYCE
ncbi:unnamed protein product [Sphagnum balticum]